jgi:hypothetical protein
MRFHDDAARGYMSFEPLDENSSNFHTHKTVKKFVKFNDDRERSYFFNSFPLFSTELVLIITDGDDPLFFQYWKHFLSSNSHNHRESDRALNGCKWTASLPEQQPHWNKKHAKKPSAE